MSPNMTYDAIIVGLGPAGSSAAYELARRGHHVLALEKYELPREKVCGGCLSAKIQAILDDDLSKLAEAIINRVVLTFRGQSEIIVESPEPVAYMVTRSKFDYYLVQKAEGAGAEVRDAEGVRALAHENGYHVVQTPKGTYRSRYLVGADGVNGVTARLLGYGPKRQLAVALEGEVKVDPEVFASLEGTVRLDLGAIPYGYGWIFPKRDHWSLGVGSVQELREHPKKYYSAFVTDQYVADDIREESRHGFRIPLFLSQKSKITSGPSLLVGDAAALVDPFLGEGIYYAISSGQMAAQTIHESLIAGSSDLSFYQERVAGEMYPEFMAAARIADFAYHFNKLGFALFKAHPETAESFIGVLRGTLSYRDFWAALRREVKYGLFEFLTLLKQQGRKVTATYDRIAPQYDAMRFLWQETLGRDPLDHFRSLLKKHVPAGARVLDAGAGTGESIRTLLQVAKPSRVIGVDISEKMLDIARRKISNDRVQFQQANITRLPFPDRSFDVVISSWAIETLQNPRTAVQEFLRVIKDDGYVIYVFSSLPRGLRRFYAFLIEKSLGKTFDWHFLDRNERPYHSCEHSRLITFARGLATVVVLRKCCDVTDEVTACKLPKGWKPAEMTHEELPT